MVTQRAWLIGGIGFCFYLIAIVNTLPSFYYALTWLAVGVLGSSMAIALLSLIGLRCAWKTPHAVISQPLDFETDSDQVGPVVEVELANGGTLNKTGVRIEIHLCQVSAREEEKGKKASEANRIKRTFLVEALPSGQRVTTKLPLLHLPRGRWQVEELRLFGSDVLGLFRVQKRVPAGVTMNTAGEVSEDKSASSRTAPEIVVGPATLPASQQFDIRLARSRGDSGTPAARFMGQGDEIRGTRLYAPGDDLRHVHWKSTARKGQLVVKEFHHTMQTRAVVLWDGAAESGWGNHQSEPGHLPIHSIEWGLVLVASLCRAMEERHQPCTLLRVDGEPLRAGQDTEARPVANGSLPNAALSMSQVAQFLADARADRDTPLNTAITRLTLATDDSDRNGGDAFWVTSSLAGDLAGSVGGWTSRGARVTIAFLDASAFLDATGAEKKNLVQHQAQTAAGDAEEFPVTAELYAARFKALQNAGARVIRVAPEPGQSSEKILHAVLHEMLSQRQYTREHEAPGGEPQLADSVSAREAIAGGRL